MTALATALRRTGPAALCGGLLLLCSAAAPALAVDLGPLRGSQSYDSTSVVKWQGGYFAGAAGVTTGRIGGSGAVGDLIATGLRGTRIENEMQVSNFLQPRISAQQETTYGFLAGYNFQFGETVLGLEADVTIGGAQGSGSDSLGRSTTLSDGYFATANASGSVSAEIKRMATLRARAGYTLGAFLPFVTAGLAVAEYSLSATATVDTLYSNPALVPPVIDPVPQTWSTSTTKFTYGLAAGAGVDVALTENVFIRGEWQYVYLPDLEGGNAALNTVRAAAGVKF